MTDHPLSRCAARSSAHVVRSPTGDQHSGPRSRQEHFDGVSTAHDAQSSELLVSVRTGAVWRGVANDTLLCTHRKARDGAPQWCSLGFARDANEVRPLPSAAQDSQQIPDA